MDGQKTILLIDNRFGTKFDLPAPAAFDSGWLLRLAEVGKVLSSELVAITANGYDVKTEHATSADRGAKDIVTIEVRTNDKVGQYLKNHFLETSDTRRIYTLDAKTHRLENVKFYCRSGGEDVLVLELVKIDYNPAIDDSTFKLDIPENVVWSHEPERLPDNEKYEKMTPSEAARRVLPSGWGAELGRGWQVLSDGPNGEFQEVYGRPRGVEDRRAVSGGALPRLVRAL